VEVTVRWKAWKSKNRFSTLPTTPWKSRPQREIPTLPQRPLRPAGKLENQQQVSHFPSRLSRRLPRFLFFHSNSNGLAARRKGNRLLPASFPLYFLLISASRYKVLSCSFLDWKMLASIGRNT